MSPTPGLEYTVTGTLELVTAVHRLLLPAAVLVAGTFGSSQSTRPRGCDGKALFHIETRSVLACPIRLAVQAPHA